MTLDTLNYSNRQDIFDFIVAHLRDQGRKAINTYGPGDVQNCAYLTLRGETCAAGCLIPFDEYQEVFEGQYVKEGIDENGEGNDVTDYFMSKHADLRLLRTMQSVHDDTQVVSWEEEFMRVADDWHLAYTPPNRELCK